VKTLEESRREFAEKIRSLAGLRSSRLVEAFATVPREQFLGPGPWLLTSPVLGSGYRLTPDDDPRWLYDNVLVALDADRNLNNGEPAALARWLDALDLAPRTRFLHIGCGVGYYTAIAAAAISGGSLVGVELDPDLAERARRNLSRWPQVSVIAGDGSDFADDPFDVIFVNAGATEPLPRWLDQIRVGGRLLVPMTVDLPTPGLGGGHMLLITRHAAAYSARFISPVGVFHCGGARTSEGRDLLKRAYVRGGQERVRSVRRDQHPSTEKCWLHGAHFCLSFLPAES
jgi:protein-L-isoaspartate(D-aspartate) O-methyltransferase